MLVFSALLVCLAFVYYAYHGKDLLEERNIAQAEIKKLELFVAELPNIEKQNRDFKQELSHLEKRLERLDAILPAQKETHAVLRGLQQMAASSNLKINKLIPKQAIPREFYSDWPIHMEVAGNYNALGLFLEKISRATSLINVTTISVNGTEKHTDPTQTLTASCTTIAYVFKDSAHNALQSAGVVEFPMDHAGISYKPNLTRDPFVNPLRLMNQPKIHDEQPHRGFRPPGIAGTYIAELSLEGISLRNDGRLAIVRGGDKRAYFLKEGDRLFDGYLKAIQTDSIVLVRETNLGSGKILAQDVTKRLRKP